MTSGDHGRRDRKPQSESAVVDGYKETFSSGHSQASCTHKFTVVVRAQAKPMGIQSRPHPDMKMGAERETPLVAMDLLAAVSCERQGSWGVSHAPEEDHTSTDT